MKEVCKYIILCLVPFVIVSCGSKRSTAERGNKKKVETREQYLFKKSDDIFEAYRSSNHGKVNDFTIAYIGTYKNIAIDKMLKYNIPVSITLAQGILESGNGLSTLTKKANNHFGIKCHSGWKGKRVYHDDDRRQECFRKYPSAEGSFNDHSLFLTSRGRYEFLFDLKPDDYKGWARGLKKAGYATDRKYPKKLISFIETFELYKYDDLVLDDKGYKKSLKLDRGPVLDEDHSIANRDSKDHDIFITVIKGDTLYSIARNNNLTVDDLKRINGLDSNEISVGMKLLVTK